MHGHIVESSIIFGWMKKLEKKDSLLHLGSTP